MINYWFLLLQNGFLSVEVTLLEWPKRDWSRLTDTARCVIYTHIVYASQSMHMYIMHLTHMFS